MSRYDGKSAIPGLQWPNIDLGQVPAGVIDCGTNIVYRDVVINNCDIRLFDQSVLHEDSQTDVLTTVFRIEGMGYVTTEVAESLGLGFSNTYLRRSGAPTGGETDPDIVGDNAGPADRLDALQRWLQQPRGDFWFFNEGEILVVARGSDMNIADLQAISSTEVGNQWALLNTYDVRQGPKTRDIRVIKIAGARAYQVYFAFVIHKNNTDPVLVGADSSGGSGVGVQDDPDETIAATTQNRTVNPLATEEILASPGNPERLWKTKGNRAVLNNRYSVTDTRNADFLHTRTIRGTMTCRSKQEMPFLFRNLIIPGLIRGYQRVSCSFLQSPDGLSLNYEITDQQRYAAPPRPAIDWRATHQEDLEGFGYTGVAAVSVWLKGGPGTPKMDLLLAALQIIYHRIGDLYQERKEGSGTADEEFIRPIRLSLVDIMHENEIQLIVTIQRYPDHSKEAIKLARVANRQLGQLSKVDPRDPNTIPNYDATDPDVNERDDNVVLQWNRDSWPQPFNYDSSDAVGQFLAYLQNPNHSIHGIPRLLNEQTFLDGYKSNPYSLQDPARPSGVFVPLGGGAPVPLDVFAWKGELLHPYVQPPAYQEQLSDAHKSWEYESIELESIYGNDIGLGMNPVAAGDSSTGETVKFTRCHSGVTTRKIFVKAKRVGRQPTMPDIVDTLSDAGITGKLLHWDASPAVPELLANGRQYLYDVEYQLTYGMANPATKTSPLRSGAFDSLIQNASGTTFQPSTHQRGDLI